MPVDEFGREIPGRGGGSGGGSQVLLDAPLPSSRMGADRDRGDRDRDRDRSFDRPFHGRGSGGRSGGGGGGGGGGTDYDDTDDLGGSGGERGRGTRSYRDGESRRPDRDTGGTAAADPYPPLSSPRHRNTAGTGASFQSPHNHRSSHHDHHGNNNHHRRSITFSGGGGNNSSNPQMAITTTSQKKNHPSYQYVDEPLLCHFLWKEEQKIELQQQKNSSEGEAQPQQPPTTIPNEEDMNQPEDATATSAADAAAAASSNDAPMNENTASDNKTADNDAASLALYDNYKKAYCLNYIRAFFNHHLDDSWFRIKYSPAAQYQFQLLHRTVICHGEAAAMAQQISVSNKNPLEFVASIRLGGGIKLGSTSATDNTEAAAVISAPATPSGHLFSFQQPLHVLAAPARATPAAADGESQHTATGPKAALHITEIPPHVTDAQLLTALTLHIASAAAAAAGAAKKSSRKTTNTGSSNIASGSSELLTLFPTSTMTTVGRRALQRDVIAIGAVATIQEILRSLSNAHNAKRRGGSGSGGGPSGNGMEVLPRKDGVLPRKGEVLANLELYTSTFSLDVECSDPYGRVEVDADGHGAAPADGLPVPLRKAVVLVGALAPHQDQSQSQSQLLHRQQQQRSGSGGTALPAFGGGGGHHHGSGLGSSNTKCVTVTLSAALSSSQRWSSDTTAALQLAAMLDKHQRVPMGCRLQDILASLPISDHGDDDIDDTASAQKWLATDRLDVAVAYLRRVHCMSFYQGCVQAESVADVVTGKSPVSTIYLRLQQADEILAQATAGATGTAADADAAVEDANAPPENQDGPKDMLVQRLDDAIDRALRDWSNDTDDTGINRITAQQDLEHAAASIRDAEANVRQKWMADHAIMDADGRARCSFAFCHKLFKDVNFLNQHLLKKHAEFLYAEQAKCHDGVMMAAWDSGTQHRPVPEILVDCGVRFGMVAAPVSGGPIPNCTDPEPELWRREEERREREAEMKARRAELRTAAAAAAAQQHGFEHQHAPVPSQPRPRPTFVDVDDMKEEKVELSFDAVAVPDTSVNTVLKKKKKRKLL